jgi:hypothetical protein
MRGSVGAVGERRRWTIALPRLLGADASTKALRSTGASRSGRSPVVVFGVIWTCTTCYAYRTARVTQRGSATASSGRLS